MAVGVRVGSGVGVLIDSYQGVCGGRRGRYYLIVVGFFSLCCVCLFVHYLFSLPLVPN